MIVLIVTIYIVSGITIAIMNKTLVADTPTIISILSVFLWPVLSIIAIVAALNGLYSRGKD